MVFYQPRGQCERLSRRLVNDRSLILNGQSTVYIGSIDNKQLLYEIYNYLKNTSRTSTFKAKAFVGRFRKKNKYVGFRFPDPT
jgi:hypothetical protein